VDLKNLLSSAPATVFSVHGCKACKQAVKEIKQEDIACSVIDCSKKSGDATRAALLEATGTSAIPSVWIGDKYIGSLEDGPEPRMGVLPMIESGKLQQLVAAQSQGRGCNLLSTPESFNS